MDGDLKNILDELQDGKVETFNRSEFKLYRIF